MSVQHLHLPFEKVNPVGGAIALGHPLGATGARQVATALAEAKRENKKVFVTSMCIGSGMVSLCTAHGDITELLMSREWLVCLSMSNRDVLRVFSHDRMMSMYSLR